MVVAKLDLGSVYLCEMHIAMQGTLALPGSVAEGRADAGGEVE